MRRSIFLLMLGILCSALLCAAISVYLFHDVDQDKIGHWNEAFAGLCSESIVFTLIIGIPVWLFTLLGRHLFHLTGYSPRAKLGLLLGTGVTVLQYPWEFAARLALPRLADSALSLYLIVAITSCTAILLCDNFRQKKLHKGHEASSST